MARILSVSLCVLLLLSGCTRLVVREIPDDPQVVVDTKDEPLQPAAIEAVRVSAPKNIVDAAHQVLGDEGSLPPKKDLTIDANGVKVTLHPGSTLDYQYKPESGSMFFTFNDPKPTVAASVGIFTIRPPLLSLQLLPDNTGVATVQTAVGKVNRKFSIAWEDESSGLPAAPRARDGVLRFHVAVGYPCPACDKGKKDLEQAKKEGKLPFEYEITEDSVHWTDSRPVITCESQGKSWTPVYGTDDKQSGAKKGDYRPGWYGIDDAAMWWSQVPKTKPAR